MKKERLLLENIKTIDKGTLIDLIAAGLPSSVTNELDRELLKETEDLYSELGKLQHLISKKKFDGRGQVQYKNNYTKEKTEKKPCKICDSKNKGIRYHPETTCWFKTKDNRDKNYGIKCINNAEGELEKESPKN